MNPTSEALARLRMRFSRAMQPVRSAKYFAGRWMRRKFTGVPGVESAPLTRVDVAGVRIMATLPTGSRSRELPMPRALGPASDRFFQSRREFPVFERYLARIEGARIHAPDGFLYLPDGRVLLEHHFFFREHIENHDLYFAAKPEPRLIEGPVFPMIGFCPAAHYHWMTEVLYRLHGVLEHLPDETRFLIPSRALPVHREVLKAFGIGGERCIEMDRTDHFRFSDLWYAPPVTKSGYDIPEVAQWVRERFARHFAPAVSDSGIPTPERVYVTRRHAHKRRIVNEAALIEYLDAAGYQCVECEKLSFIEQVAAFSQAREVIAPHGAGLVNLLFAPSSGRVLEIFPEEIPLGGTCYWSLASALHWDYTYVRGSLSGRGENDSDMMVPVDTVVSWAQTSGAESEVRSS